MKKILALAAACLLLGKASSKAQTEKTIRNTTIAVFGTQFLNNYHFSEKAGQLSHGATLQPGFGASISKDYYFKFLPKDCYLSLGLRYTRFSVASVDAKTSMYGFGPSTGTTLKFRNETVSVPIHFGKTFRTKHLLANVFGGSSVGFSGNGPAWMYYTIENNGSGEGLSLDTKGDGFVDLGSYKFYSTLDLGLRIHPKREWQNLGLGVQLFYDLTRTEPISRAGAFTNTSRGISENYSYTVNRKAITAALSISYTFNRRWKAAYGGR